MSNFPTSLPSISNPSSTDPLNSPAHATIHGQANDELTAIATKVGVDSSAVTTTHDYKLSGVTGTDKAVSKTGAETLTNKRSTKRTETAADATSITPSWDSYDVTKQVNTQGSGTLTINAPSGTPVDMDIHEIAIKSTNSQTYSFNATYKAGNVALPTTHSGSSKWDIFLFQYSSTDTNWKLVTLLQAIA